MSNLFYLLIAVLPLENHWLWRFELFGNVTVLKVLGFVCLIGATVSICQNGFNGKLLQSWPIRLYLVYLVLQCGSYFLHGADREVDIGNYLNVLSILSLAVVTLVTVKSFLRFHRTLLLCIGGAAFASLYTIRGQQGAPSIAGFRPSGIFEDANYYALVVGLWIPLAYLWSFGDRPKRERMFCLICFTAMFLGNTFAASRGGFLGLAAALLFMIWHSRRRLRNLTIVLMVTGPLLIFAPNSPIRRFLHPDYGDMGARDARLIAWTAGLRMIEAYPFTGVGLGNFKRLMARYADPGTPFTSVAHNTYIETAAELGAPALIVHIANLVSTFLTFGRIRRRAAAVHWRHFYQCALGLQAGTLSYAVGAIFVSTWWQKIPWLLVFLAGSLQVFSETAIKRDRHRQLGLQLRPARQVFVA